MRQSTIMIQLVGGLSGFTAATFDPVSACEFSIRLFLLFSDDDNLKLGYLEVHARGQSRSQSCRATARHRLVWEIRRCTFFHGTLAGLRGLQSSYHHDRHMDTYQCQLRLDLKAAHVRHILVEDNTVRRMIL
jgi:hypothetical protein